MSNYLYQAGIALAGQNSVRTTHNNYIEFFDHIDPVPSWEQIQEKIAELEADYDSKQYQRDRAAAYPSWQDQLDKIFHSGINAWKADIQAIKDQYPKP